VAWRVYIERFISRKQSVWKGKGPQLSKDFEDNKMSDRDQSKDESWRKILLGSISSNKAEEKVIENFCFIECF